MRDSYKYQELFKKLDNGDVKLYNIEADLGVDSNEATLIRASYLESKFHASLDHIKNPNVDFSKAINSNIENSVGAITLPLGYAGAIKVSGLYASGEYPILIATTEGKLVAGLSRGISTISKSGGVSTRVLSDGMARDVMVSTESVNDAFEIYQFVNSREGIDFLKSKFKEKTAHGDLLSVKCYQIGKILHIRFKAFTGAAMGMNMVTIAAEYSSEQLLSMFEGKGIKAKILSESGNMCTDKKPSAIDFIEGRGVSVTAEAVIKKELLEKARSSARDVERLNRLKSLEGSAMAGSSGFNAQVANILAGMYAAYGQDIAQIVEGSQSIVEAEESNGDLYISILLPSLEVGTYGGGTRLDAQKEALKLLGLYGEGDLTGSSRLAFAEIVASVALAGELNLLIIESSHELSKSHGELNRK
ncbi:hydroxymethylglutaryl-CoA reductase [Candidatus Mancarchaeum acidiphilum]|uniref:hydroxymethylglutaryl-CoA reductase (NADPH) n=1 Tax=Candidatus Mancarchaeum acidiphilum TaxID=1920749 RepID=A0A218NMG4_9ARCH|nr:hydroxymethylglutaryl-CoA reductase [Candidatus Mancarchaeum acidiphilum]ASI13656.1 hydroxymethylglutaryl-CoA reductase [Candidatus Mancarchaeum acidiphilum]